MTGNLTLPDVNPFLHITIHTVIENQLEARDPIEVLQFYNAMRKKKCSHHDTIHLIGAIFISTGTNPLSLSFFITPCCTFMEKMLDVCFLMLAFKK